eukprot:1002221_1
MSGVIAIRDEMQSIITTVTGLESSYITEFEFQVGKIPMTSLRFPLITVLLYCIFIPLLQNYMKGRSAPPLKYILIIHNIFLSSISFFLAIFLIVSLLSISQQYNYGFTTVFCALNHYEQTGHLQFIYYVNHLLKYYELLDTIFLALKGKKISFLHGYHHPATLVLTWTQLIDSTGVQWVVILLNLFVHSVMYFYYTMAALKIRMPWKKIVTISQIVQFILDLTACYTAWAVHNFYGKCFGTNRAGITGCFILSSYLFLFVDFYQMTYNKKKNNKNKSKIENVNINKLDQLGENKKKK